MKSESMEPRISPIVDDFLKGALGWSSAAFGVITSFQENIEWALRIGTLATGLVVSILTAISIFRKMPKK